MDEHRPRDPGFTLTETIVVVLLVAVLASVIVAVVAVISRTVPSTEASVDNSRSYQGLITSLPSDAASTPPGAFAIPSSPDCAGIGGVALLQMSWDVGGTTWVAGYRLEADGDGQRLLRYECSGPSTSAPFPNPIVRVLTSRLHDASVAAVPSTGTAVGVRFDLTTCGKDGRRTDCTLPGAVVSVAAGSRNPGPSNTLPP